MVGPDGAVDWRAQLLSELQEEVGIAPEQVRGLLPEVLVLDHRDRVLDVCARIDVVVPELPGPERRVGAEYSELVWVSSERLPEFLATHEDELVPGSLAWLRHLPAGSRDRRAGG